MRTYDTAVIGGGIAGLVTAIELAQAKQSVIVLERLADTGGRAMTIHRNGAWFNLGAHALYRDGVAYRTFQEWGFSMKGGTPPRSGVGILKQELYPLPANLLHLLSSRLLSVGGKMELAKLLAGLTKLDHRAMPHISLREWVEEEIGDDMVRKFFYAISRTSTYANDPDFQLIGPVIQQLQYSFKSSVVYLDGGWKTLVDQLVDKARSLGVTVQHHRQVTEIQHADGRVQGVRFAEGETLPVRQVVSTASPAETYKLVPQADQTSLLCWKNQARPLTAAAMDLSLRRLPVPNRDAALGLDQPVYFSNHSRVAKLSDDGSIVVHLLKYQPPGESDAKADERLLEATMSLLHPGWQQEVISRQYLPKITVSADYLHKGRVDMYPGPAVPEIDGLYVAGDWASHGEVLVDASVASSKRAAQQIMFVQQCAVSR